MHCCKLYNNTLLNIRFQNKGDIKTKITFRTISFQVLHSEQRQTLLLTNQDFGHFYLQACLLTEAPISLLLNFA